MALKVIAEPAAGPAAGFDVLSYAPLLWLDFNDPATQFTDASEATPTVNGASIGRDRDKSGNNRHADQATAGAKFTRNDTAINGRIGATLDGGDRLVTPAFSWNAVHTKYLVAAGGVSGDRYVIDGITGDRGAIFFQAGVSNRIGTYGGSIVSYTVDPLTARAVCVVHDGASSVLRVDGVETTGNPGSTVSETAGCKIGGYGVNNSLDFTGAIGEVLIFNGAHDLTTRNLFMSYLKTKWGTP